MPKLNRTLILDMGIEALVHDYMNNGITKPEHISDRLNQDPAIMAKAQSRGASSGVMAEDVRIYLNSLKVGDESATTAILKNSPDAQNALSSIRDRVNGLVKQCEQWEVLGYRLMNDISEMQHDWRIAKESGVPKEELPEYPLMHIQTASKSVKTLIDLIRSVKGDDKVQQIMRAGQVNVSQGYSQDELFEYLFGVGELLGHDASEVTSAFTKYQKSRSSPDVIEAEVDSQDRA